MENVTIKINGMRGQCAPKGSTILEAAAPCTGLKSRRYVT